MMKRSILPPAPVKGNGRFIYVSLSLAYYAILSWIYVYEISLYWEYMGFKGQYSNSGFALSFSLVLALSIIVPLKNDTRSILITTMSFLFFIPSIIYISFPFVSVYHLTSIVVLFTSILLFSSINFRLPEARFFSENAVLSVTIFLILLAVAMQASYGGLRNFNLDIERVYEFRREDANALPDFFGYVYSNIVGALVPVGIILSQKYNRNFITFLVVALTIILFGMTHHKSILFAPIGIYIFYKSISMINPTKIIPFSFLFVISVCLGDIFYNQFILSINEPSYIASLIARRTLLVPSMLDGLYIEFFDNNVKYYWSNSKILSWALGNPYEIAAPFIIGYEYFYDMDTSANTGVIGSGFSNAGLMGVVIYSILSGLFLSLLNNYGRMLGHTFVSSASVVIFFMIMSTTDLVTAVLSHGLLLLIILLTILPQGKGENGARKGLA